MKSGLTFDIMCAGLTTEVKTGFSEEVEKEKHIFHDITKALCLLHKRTYL
jgi:hypothetical protein